MPEVVYMSEYAVLYHGRAEDVLPTIDKAKYDLIVMDPPYGVQYRSNRGQNFDAILNDDGGLDLDLVVAECCRILRPWRHLYVFGGLGFGDAPVGGTASLVWDKEMIGMGDLSLPWGPQHEAIDFGVYVPSKAARKRGDGRLAARLRQGSVLRVQRPNSRQVSRHPTEKPILLLRQLIESSSCIGDIVLDPFLGSGSTAVAAILSGRRCVGVELDEQYLPTAIERIKAAETLAARMLEV